MTTLTQMREAAALLQPDDPVHKALIWADMELAAQVSSRMPRPSASQRW